MTKHGWTSAGLALVLGTLAVSVAVRARAGDPPADVGPKAEKKIGEHALVKALKGSWSVQSRSPGGELEYTGKATFALACGDTMLLNHYEADLPGIGKFHGLGALKIGADGKSGSFWWFDSWLPQPNVLAGPLTDSGYEVSGAGPQGPLKITMEKRGEGFEYSVWVNGAEFARQTYTRSK